MSQVYLVTGANSGLRFDSVRKLAILPATKIWATLLNGISNILQDKIKSLDGTIP